MQFKTKILRQSTVVPSPRLAQVLGMFDLPAGQVSQQSWDIDLEIPKNWNIGVIVGPSGSGKTTIASELFGDHLMRGYSWQPDRSILDDFPKQLGIRDIVGLLSSVGFSSPPAWLRPFHVLSNGQQFRVNLARTLAEAMVDQQIKVVDEYSSVVDRTVARIGSAAIAKTVRRLNLKFIAVTCHYDVLDWLEPDWVFDPSSPGREGVRQSFKRPNIELEIIHANSSAWQLFKPHHYLSSSLHRSAACYVGLVDQQPAAFTAVLFSPQPHGRSGWREHRTVCLPDFQGVGIGNAMSEFVASIYRATGKRYTSTTSHPAMIRHRCKSPLWRMTRAPSLAGGHSRTGNKSLCKRAAIDRLTAGFEYIGPIRRPEAARFGVL